MNNSYLHVFPNGPYSLLFSKLIMVNNLSNHKILIPGKGFELKHLHSPNIIPFKGKFNTLLKFIKYSNKYDIIVFHGFWYQTLMLLALLLPNVSNKVVWVIWGNDLYNDVSPIDYFLKKKLAQRSRLITSHVKDDYCFALKKYRLKDKPYKWSSYPINYDNIQLRLPSDVLTDYKIMLAHSGDKANKHKYVLDIINGLSSYSYIKIFVPLSYGDSKYINSLIDYINTIKNNHITIEVITDFMENDYYQAFLCLMDIAIFPADRQIALANIIQLLALGKKVFLSSKSPTWKHLESLGIVVYDILNLDSKWLSFDYDVLKSNHEKTLKTYSIENLLNLWGNL